MPKLTGIAVNLDGEGRLHMVASAHAEEPGATMWHAWQAGPGAPEWSLWHPFGEPGPGDPGVPAMYQDYVTSQLGLLVVSSGDQAVWHRRQADAREPDKWSDWESLGRPDGDPVQGPVATATLSEGQVMAVVVAAGAVWQTTITDDSDVQRPVWSPLDAPEVATVRAVSVSTPSDGQCELVALVEWPSQSDPAYPDDSRVLWHRQLQAGIWSDWEPLFQPPGHSVPVGTPVLAGKFNGDLELFTQTGDGAVWHAAMQQIEDPGAREMQQIEDPGAREPWAMLVRPGYSFGDLAATLDTDGRVLVVAPTSAGNHLWYSLQSAYGSGTWSPLSPLSVVPDASAQDVGALTCPVLLPDGTNRMQLYVVMPATGTVYHCTADEPGQLPTILEPITHP